MIIFDIETMGLPKAELEPLCPQFEAPSNYRDAAKIEAYRDEKRQEWLDRAALSAVTGHVLAIGYLHEGKFNVFASGDEADDIAAFWDLVAPRGILLRPLVGFNCNGFDVPYMVRRSWKLGVQPPHGLFRGRWLNDAFVDLMEMWRCGTRDTSISLADLARYLGVGEKTGSGKDFAALWESDRDAALKYLENDLRLTARCAQRFGVLGRGGDAEAEF